MKRKILNIAALFGLAAMASANVTTNHYPQTKGESIGGRKLGMVNENPIYLPKKHTVCSYAAQKRAAKKRRNIKKFNRK